ncbi:hypothetical protein RCL_jg2206.t1 [Rhizophagus clarus]|uniref:Uncharacterized protein n=1 Tax=Rhizophagus clarus TaxID=94130 RepID=A0A8H3KUD8_9GLOM|nr:hypothetical protein RCL_jg2206.t1 [Rhizophagus clarus]
MPSVFSTIGYIVEAETTTLNSSDNSTFTKGIIACNRPEKNDPVFVNFISFNLPINTNCVYLINGKFVNNVTDQRKSNKNTQELQFNVMMAYQIKIIANNTPEQEIFMSFQCTVLSVPIVEGNNIQFKTQVIEFNGKNRTEIPITCICPIHNLRLSNKVNKLQKGNKLDTIGNLIKNEDEIIVTVTYIVYANNMNSLSSFDKKDTMTKLPWLDPSKVTSEDPPQNVNSDFFNSINDYKYGKMDQVDKVEGIIKPSDDDDNNSKELSTKKTNKRKYNRKSNNNLADADKPSRRTRKKLSDLATEFLEGGSDID